MIIDFSKYYTPKPKQLEAHKCRAKYILFGGSMGGGKSWWLCAEAIKQAMKYKGNRLVIVRKELSVLKRTILVTFFSICPKEIIASFNQTSLEVTFINGSKLVFLDANISKDPLLQKLKGLEIGWFGIDEANEVAKDAYNILKTRLRWILPNKQKPSYEGRLTSNPETCWLIDVFINSKNPNEVYIKSITTDNYDENSEYVKNLKDAFKDTPNLLRKYLFADWSILDAINQLMPSEKLHNSKNKLSGGYGTSLGVDVARFGDDNSVFIVLIDGNIELIETYPYTPLNEVVDKTIELINRYNISPDYVGVDSVGLGAGVVDSLHALGYDVIELNGGSKPIDEDNTDTFLPFNLRSQMYYNLRNEIIAGNIGGIENDSLIQELTAIKYEISSDRKLRINSKEAIKKILGKSPDLADALCYANWVKTFRGVYNPMLPIFGGY
ncbi:MAG: terminase [Sphingobacteriales bacterium]|nr:MAG: terminase [Sphingobacteriales bacterium]